MSDVGGAVAGDPDRAWMTATLVCPQDRSALEDGSGELVCVTCGRRFPVTHGVPDFVDRDAAPDRWRDAQSYEIAFWEREGKTLHEAHAAQYRADADRIARVLDEHASGVWPKRVLQIGAGPQAQINFLPADERYALEPLAPMFDEAGLLARDDVRWVAGMGERLPFGDGAFSLIVIANVIDHVADPAAVLREIRRCLAPDGVVWLTCNVSPPPLLPIFGVMGRLRLGYFRGHPWYYSAGRLAALCRREGFRIDDRHAGGYRLADLWSAGSLRRRIKPLVLRVQSLVMRAS